MKVVILAGGLPSTLTDDRQGIPKPMVEIGGRPILWHIMKNYATCGFNEFIVCTGYKKETIKDYFHDFYVYQSDITVDLGTNEIRIHKKVTEDWKVTIVDTGLYSSTMQRVSRIEKYIDGDTFVVSLGDCLSDLDINAALERHGRVGKIMTDVLAHPTGRNRLVDIDVDGNFTGFGAGQHDSQAWVDAGTYIFDRRVFPFLNGNYRLEKELLETLGAKGQVATYRHQGFWSPVETARDKGTMESLWNAGMAPWIIWREKG